MNVDGSVTVTCRVAVSARGTASVSPMSETAECHDAEAGGTKQKTRSIEVHRSGGD